MSDENKGRHTCRYRGDGDEGSILRPKFFAHKNKKATLYLTGLSNLAHASGSIAWLLDHLIRLRQHVRRYGKADLIRGLEINH